MTSHVTYELADSIATITMDDGKVNALSLDMLNEINVALDQAVKDRAVVVLTVGMASSPRSTRRARPNWRSKHRSSPVRSVA